MIEQLATLLGRHLHVRGVGRVLRLLYPCRSDSPRFVLGTRTRGDGLQIEVDTRQLIDWSLLFHGEYEPHMRQLFQTLLSPGATVVDCGANIGAHTLTFANLVGPSGRVLAFEPNPSVRCRLERNLAINAIDHVAVYDGALGATNTKMLLRVPTVASVESANPGLASLVALDTPHDLVEVQVRTLDSVVAATGLERVDLVKIDVQGYEHPVLQGMTAVINRFVPAIIFEYEDWAWAKAGCNLRDVFELVQKLPYSFWKIDYSKRLKLTPLRPESYPGAHTEILAISRQDQRLLELNRLISGSLNE